MSASLIIPAYNEEKRLAPFLETVMAYVKQHPADLMEVLVVDDGSRDQTPEIASAFQKRDPRIRIIQLTPNQGKGAAVAAGVAAAAGNPIIFIDADGATPITELPKMLAALQVSDIAVGNRWLSGATSERHSPLRWLSGLVYRNYMKIFGLGHIDTMCGFKGYQQAVAKTLFQDLLEKRWLFDTEVAYKAKQRGYSVTSIPIRWTSQDGSKLSTFTLFKSALQIWPLIRRLRRATEG
jgi:glycosyltransferase involved in cell wall biosynthesis